MKTFATLRKSGNSLIVTIPEKIVSMLNLSVEDMIEIDISKPILKYKDYKCNICLVQRSIREDEDIYCTACGNDQMEEVHNV
jgi:antitoxin component of MazEF toxin-antitoxin module